MEFETLKSVEPDGASKSKGGEDKFLKNLDLNKLEMIDSIDKPLFVQNLQYFVDIGLFCNEKNSHKLKKHKYIPTLEIEKIFRKWNNCIGYCYIKNVKM